MQDRYIQEISRQFQDFQTANSKGRFSYKIDIKVGLSKQNGKRWVISQSKKKHHLHFNFRFQAAKLGEASRAKQQMIAGE